MPFCWCLDECAKGEGVSNTIHISGAAIAVITNKMPLVVSREAACGEEFVDAVYDAEALRAGGMSAAFDRVDCVKCMHLMVDANAWRRPEFSDAEEARLNREDTERAAHEFTAFKLQELAKEKLPEWMVEVVTHRDELLELLESVYCCGETHHDPECKYGIWLRRIGGPEEVQRQVDAAHEEWRRTLVDARNRRVPAWDMRLMVTQEATFGPPPLEAGDRVRSADLGNDSFWEVLAVGAGSATLECRVNGRIQIRAVPTLEASLYARQRFQSRAVTR
jgi:hypothetical protein